MYQKKNQRNKDGEERRAHSPLPSWKRASLRERLGPRLQRALMDDGDMLKSRGRRIQEEEETVNGEA